MYIWNLIQTNQTKNIRQKNETVSLYIINGFKIALALYCPKKNIDLQINGKFK